MYPGYDERPYDPRRDPAPVPSAGVFDSPYVVLCLNSEWAGHIDGLLDRLLYPDAWRGTDAEIESAITQVNQLLVKLAQIRECLLDGQVAVSPTDTTPDYLVNKLSALPPLQIDVANAGSNEQLVISAPGVAKSTPLEFAAGDTLPIQIASVLAGQRALSVRLVVNEAFDNGAQLSVGVPGNTSLLMLQTENDPATPDTYIKELAYEFPSDVDIFLFGAGVPTVGQASVLVITE